MSNERGRPKFLLSRRIIGYSCGGGSSKGSHKMEVYCNVCNDLEVACLSNAKSVRVDTRYLFPEKTRLATGCAIDNPGLLADMPLCSAPASNHTLATHAKLRLPSTRLKDLSEAFGQSRGHQASTTMRTA